MPVLNESPQLLISSSANVLPFIKYCEKHKVDWLSIAHKSGIKRDLLMSLEWYMSRDLMRFVQLLSLETTPTLGIDVAMESTLNEVAPDIARLVANVGSLEQALSIVIESMNVLNSHVKFWAERIDGHWFICHMARSRSMPLAFLKQNGIERAVLFSYVVIFMVKIGSPMKSVLLATIPRCREAIEGR